jgi:CRISPR-associated protein Cmr4
MYQKAYGIIETLAPLHVGASSGEESGNLNLIFRDQFTQTGIIPGSSIRGRFRADLRLVDEAYVKSCYGDEGVKGSSEKITSESSVKFEYASLVWLPVFCPGQPKVYITCPELLKRYYKIAKSTNPNLPHPTSANFPQPDQVKLERHRNVLFFNLGFIDHLQNTPTLSQWLPPEIDIPPTNLLVVEDASMGIIHDLALFRQSRVKLKDDEKIVDSDQGGFFNTEALPEGSILIFPIAIKKGSDWQDALELSEWEKFNNYHQKELYFGGLESIGFGRTQVTLNGQFFQGGK